MTTILLIEDEVDLAKVLKSYLEKGGYEVAFAARGDAGLALWKQVKPDLVLLDLNLPGMDGLEILKEIRKAGDIPIIVTTARIEEMDRLIGLEIGADDYISKPYSPREVVARVKTVLRRTGPKQSKTNIMRVDDLLVDQDSHTVELAGEPIELTPSEFNLLTVLASHPGRVFSRGQLLEAALGTGYEGYERTIDAHIKNIRSKLKEDIRDKKYIETVHGVGYRFRKD